MGCISVSWALRRLRISSVYQVNWWTWLVSVLRGSHQCRNWIEKDMGIQQYRGHLNEIPAQERRKAILIKDRKVGGKPAAWTKSWHGNKKATARQKSGGKSRRTTQRESLQLIQAMRTVFSTHQGQHSVHTSYMARGNLLSLLSRGGGWLLDATRGSHCLFLTLRQNF